MKNDPRVDAYIEKVPPFAQPILSEVRKRVQKALPGVEEAIKWNVPFFLLSDKIIASMAAFKKHVKVGVWVGMMPSFQDVTDVADLVAATDFAAQLHHAQQHGGDAMNSRPAEPRKNTPAPAKSTKKMPSSAAKKEPAKFAKKGLSPAAKKASSSAVKKAPAKSAKKVSSSAAKKAPAKSAKNASPSKKK